jgi:hypothetical protein
MASGETGQASVENTRKPQPGKQSYYKPNTKSEEENETGNDATITLDEAARLLNISTATIRLWSDMGLLHTNLSPKKHRTVRRADILTFLPDVNRPLSFLTFTDNELAGARFARQNRKKLAKINVEAITELTKQSVFKIDHLGGAPYSNKQ